ncbi:putative skeletal organic matrix protein 5 [Oculina patagonica]
MRRDGTCWRHVKFTTEKDGYALQSHVIKNLSLQLGQTRDPCGGQCVMESRCMSINIGPPINDRVLCELSDSDHSLHPEDLKPRAGFSYTGTKNACSSYPCFHNGTCLNGFTDKRYQCLCTANYSGVNCQIDGFQTCKDVYDDNFAEGNKAYQLQLNVGSAKVRVYCHMTADLGSCGGGGWTLVMKIDGSKGTFNYDSTLWINQEPFNLTAGETGLDTIETKLPTYWNIPFSKICLGMRIGQQLKFIVINQQANSLYSLIADGQYRATSLGRNTWKTLIGSHASLQYNCNKEGFNAACTSTRHSKARIGILANEQNVCDFCDSRIGFGTGGYPDYSNTCGNVAAHSTDNGDKYIKAMGYILVQ